VFSPFGKKEFVEFLFDKEGLGFVAREDMGNVDELR
jgi:hypothetical protein